MLKVVSFSILNMHELVETWLPETYFLKFPDLQSNVHFPDQMNDNLSRYLWFYKFQSKLRVLNTDDVKKRLLYFLFRENLLGIVLWYYTLIISIPIEKCKKDCDIV